MKERTKKLLLTGLFLVLSFCLAIYLTERFQWYRISIELLGEETVQAEYGLPYEDQGAKVEKVAVWCPLWRSDYPYETVNEVDTQNIGTFEYRYTAEFKGQFSEKSRKVEVVDTLPPEITLVADEDHYTLPNHQYEEEGYKAYDLYDGDVTDKVVREDLGDKISYNVSDSWGNEATIFREVVFDDRNPPVITFTGSDYHPEGKPFEDAYHAEDDGDGDVTDKVTVEGHVDWEKAGEYELIYRVTDSYGNTAEVTRVIKVTAFDPNKVIFLTFDDGPGPYTDKLLDILNKYDIKVTFFVTNAFPRYVSCIEREYSQGHTVGVHTYRHRYNEVYASPEAYWEDFDKMNAIIEQQTGHKADIFRFPGGSSNTVSRQYCRGIMTELAKQAKEKGYVYFDWNVESGDAGRTTDPEQVAINLINGTKKHRMTVALCHDVKSYTVEGIEKYIIWALDNGYTFLPLDKTCETAHHNIAN